jgi:hypothetical protein
MNSRHLFCFLVSAATGAFALNSRAENWRPLVSCEGGRVRLEGYRGSWQHTDFQLVIAADLEGTKKLLREGGINPSSINDKGEWILRNVTPWHGLWTFRAYAPRDAGTLVYKITPTSGKLIVNVAWTSGNPYEGDTPGFTGAEYYGCTEN